MIEKNKTCAVCGKQYTYCSGCGFQEPSYRRSMCSESCRDIYRILSAYNMNNLDKEQAAKKLRSCDLTRIEEFSPNIKKEVKAILADVPAEKAVAPQPVEVVKKEPQKEVKPALPSNYNKNNSAYKNATQALGKKK